MSRLIKAPRAPACCSKCGHIGAIFRRPLELEEGVRLALMKRQGTEAQIRARIRDMRASGLLLEV